MTLDAAANPLLDFSGLPRFDAILPRHVAPAVDALIGQARAAVAAIDADSGQPTWESVVVPLTDALDRLARGWGAVRHLNYVVNTPALREAYNAALPHVTAFYADLGQDVALYRKFLALRAGPASAALGEAERRYLDNEIRDFRLGGAELDDARRARFKAIRAELAQAGTAFDEHVLDATDDWALFVGADSLRGVPADVVERARQDAAQEGREGCKLTLRMPCYFPVMQYAEDREIRALMHRGFATIASDLGGEPAWDNGPVIDRIVALRRELAALLGYRSFAEVSLVPKMAGTPAEVLAFVRDLARRARPFGERDYAELEAFARESLGIADFAPWDVMYASEKLRAQRYDYSRQDVRRYLPADKVQAGLFRLLETLFGVTVRAAQAPVWHPSVTFHEVHDARGEVVGQFYLDLYARENKQGGAWMDALVGRRRVGARLQRPVAVVVCNLTPPAGDAPATFTHDELITLLHEFGHCMHHLLSTVDVCGVSGTDGVEWDAVELPSQFMENYCWEWDVLRDMTADTRDGPARGAPMPRALFDRMLAAKNFQSGMVVLRQLEFALFDMLLYADHAGGDRASPRALMEAVRREIAVVPRPDYDRFIAMFSHVFSGSYAAGYYSYMWARVLSADAYSLFEETGVLSPTTGARFRDEVLARGGSRPAMASFVAFRGRPPQLDALLRHNGMTLAS